MQSDDQIYMPNRVERFTRHNDHANRETHSEDNTFLSYLAIMPEELQRLATTMRARREEVADQHCGEKRRLREFAVREQRR